MERPVFLFSAGWRTGSTLVQRLLCSHPDILVWGENRGIIDSFLQTDRTIQGIQDLAREHLQNFQERGSNGWIAVMNPPAEQYREGLRRLLEAYYRDPAATLGKTRWGFKEVRHGAHAARFLAELYPDARFLFLLRDPQDALASARGTAGSKRNDGVLKEAGGPRGFLEHWTRLAASFLSVDDNPRQRTFYYEKIVEDPDQAIDEFGTFLDVDPAGFDRSVFAKKERGWGKAPNLTRADRHWLRSPWLWEVAGRHGYQPSSSGSVGARAQGWIDSFVTTLQEAAPRKAS